MGVTLDQASAGFKNQGQFIAALHVSQNLGIRFANLKAAMMGTPPPTARGTTGTGTPSTSLTSSPKSLGQAIHQLRPSDDSTTAAQAAEHEAEQDLTTTSSSTGTSSTSTAGATTGKKNSR